MASLGKKGITHHRYIVNSFRKEPPTISDEDWLCGAILVQIKYFMLKRHLYNTFHGFEGYWCIRQGWYLTQLTSWLFVLSHDILLGQIALFHYFSSQTAPYLTEGRNY